MRFRTVFLLVVAVLLVAAFAAFYGQNKKILAEQVDVFGVPLGLGTFILLAYVAGVLTFVPAQLLGDLGRGLRGLSRRFGERSRVQRQELYEKGVSAALHGRLAMALDAFGKLLHAEPNHRGALMGAGDVCRRLGDPDRAAEFHRRAVAQDGKDLAALYALARDYDEAGNTRAAEEAYRRILALEARDALDALRRVRDICVAEARWEEAAAFQERLERIRDVRAEVAEGIRRAGLGLQYEQARARLTGGDPRGAATILRRITRAEPRFTPAYVTLGEAAMALEKEDEGLAHWREGYEKTGSPVFLVLLEEHFLERSDPAAAISTFRELAARRDAGVLPRFFLGRLFSRVEMVEEAWEQFVELRGELTRSPTLDYYLGKVHERRGELAEACRLYRGVVQKTGALDLVYRCSGCGAQTTEWQAYCPDCRTWDTFRIQWTEPSPSPDGARGDPRLSWGPSAPPVETP